MINYDDLKTKPKEFLAVTGLTQEEFGHLLTAFAQIYHDQTAQQTAEGKPRRRQPGAGAKGKLRQIENKLLLLLAYQKGYELQTFLALHFGISQPQANYWIHRLLPLLQQALATRTCLPERDPAAGGRPSRPSKQASRPHFGWDRAATPTSPRCHQAERGLQR